MSHRCGGLQRFRRGWGARLGLGLALWLAPLVAAAAFGDAASILDTWYPTQWPLHNTGQDFPTGCTPGVSCQQGTPDADVDWAEAHDLGFTGQGVIVALVAPSASPDSTKTVRCLNADLIGHLWSDPGDPNVHGHNFDSNDANVCVNQAGSNHDTDVAQLALGALNGVLGVGAAPNAKLMILLGVSTETVFYNEALPWAEARGARIILFPYTAENVTTPPTNPTVSQCTSFGSTPPLRRSQKLANSNALVMWGCPNQYPACDPAALSLGATDEDDLPYADSSTPFCAHSSIFMNFAAPAGRGWLTGAAPLGISFALGTTAGVAALLLEEDPGLTRAELLERLAETADKVGPYAYGGGRNDQYGKGRLNAYRALMVGDVDGDAVPGDGDGSWVVGDSPCAGSSSGCDDNCPLEPNPSQADGGGLGPGAPADGIGDACQCGDVTGDGEVLAGDADQIQQFLAGAGGLGAADKCNVIGSPGGSASDCQIDDWVVVKRGSLGLATAIDQVCGPALP